MDVAIVALVLVGGLVVAGPLLPRFLGNKSPRSRLLWVGALIIVLVGWGLWVHPFTVVLILISGLALAWPVQRFLRHKSPESRRRWVVVLIIVLPVIVWAFWILVGLLVLSSVSSTY